jgi:1,2-phenylacetyl-CoA epoxidase catalytic subunit
MATTKDETPKVEEEVVISQKVTKKDVLDNYNKGLNYYQLAAKFFGSESEDAIARVVAIVEG